MEELDLAPPVAEVSLPLETLREVGLDPVIEKKMMVPVKVDAAPAFLLLTKEVIGLGVEAKAATEAVNSARTR